MIKKIVLLIILLLPLSVYADGLKEVSLIKCVDGDTALFLIDEDEEKVRFLAVDTPESVKPNTEVEEGGKEASSYTCDRLTNANKIELEFDPKAEKRDKYGRVLAWVYIDGNLFQMELVKNGLAEVAYVYSNYLYVEDLCNAQQNAINNKLGIWDSNRQEGYCKTKSNKKSTTVATTKLIKVNEEKVINYIIDGKYEAAIKLLLKGSNSIVISIILVIILVIVIIVKKVVKKRGRKNK